jgi:hypothetical protein
MMTHDEFTITIGTDIERDLIAASVDYGDAQVAEVLEEDGEVVVRFYPGPQGTWPALPLAELQEALEEARRRLVVEED